MQQKVNSSYFENGSAQVKDVTGEEGIFFFFPFSMFVIISDGFLISIFVFLIFFR